MLKKGYIERKKFGDKELYALELANPAFERLIGRTAEEVFANCFIDGKIPIVAIPLGDTSVEAVTSLYGLTNRYLYQSEICKNYVSAVLADDICGDEKLEMAMNMVDLLKASAYYKYLFQTSLSSNGLFDSSDRLVMLMNVLSVRPQDIVMAYRELRG